MKGSEEEQWIKDQKWEGEKRVETMNPIFDTIF